MNSIKARKKGEVESYGKRGHRDNMKNMEKNANEHNVQTKVKGKNNNTK
jgi:hypothetical protein